MYLQRYAKLGKAKLYKIYETEVITKYTGTNAGFKGNFDGLFIPQFQLYTDVDLVKETNREN